MMQRKSVTRNKIRTVVGIKNNFCVIVNTILGRGRQIVYPQHTDSFTHASLFNNYFITKIADIRNEFSVLGSDAAVSHVREMQINKHILV